MTTESHTGSIEELRRQASEHFWPHGRTSGDASREKGASVVYGAGFAFGTGPATPGARSRSGTRFNIHVSAHERFVVSASACLAPTGGGPS